MRLISQFVEEMDLTALHGTYERMPVENHASPDIMLKLMIYDTFVWKKAVTKHQARFLRKTALLVGDIIDRYDMKPLWNKEVPEKHPVNASGCRKCIIRDGYTFSPVI